MLANFFFFDIIYTKYNVHELSEYNMEVVILSSYYIYYLFTRQNACDERLIPIFKTLNNLFLFFTYVNAKDGNLII